MSDKRSLNEDEAAGYINMSSHYLRKARTSELSGVKAPGPPFIRIGRSIRYLRDDLDAWLSTRERVGGNFVSRDHIAQ